MGVNEMMIELILTAVMTLSFSILIFLGLHCYLLNDTLKYAREELEITKKKELEFMNAYHDCNLKLHELNGEKEEWTSQNRRNVYSAIHGCGTAFPNGWIVYEDGTIKDVVNKHEEK